MPRKWAVMPHGMPAWRFPWAIWRPPSTWI